MKKMIVAICVMLVSLSSLAQSPVLPQEGDSEGRGVLNIWFPGGGDFDLYSHGYGLVFQYRYWLSEAFGLVGLLGYEKLEVDDGSADLLPNDVGTFGGSVDLVPFGVGAYYAPVFYYGWTLSVEGSLRYMLVNSNVDFDPDGGSDRESVDIGDNVVFLLATDIEREISEQAALFCGFGYQMDVTKGDVKKDGEELRDNELQGFLVRVGARYWF